MSECKFAVEAFHAYIESIGLSRPAGTLGELKAFKAGADWQRSLAQAELAALKAKAVIPEKARDALAWRCLWIAYVWNDHNFLGAYKYAREEAESHGITGFDEANEWLEAQPQSDGVIVPRELLERVINKMNIVWQKTDEVTELRALRGGDHE